jgi:hypothetical protein
MKTAVIWNELEQLRYVVIDGDWNRFQGVYINSVEEQDLQDELVKLVYDGSGKELLPFVTIDVFAEAIREGAAVVECGFLP